jgi:hypothetical protein
MKGNLIFKPGSRGFFETFPRVVTTPTLPAGTTNTLERIKMPPASAPEIANTFFEFCMLWP